MPRQADLAAQAGVSDTTWNMAETGKKVGERSLVKMAITLGWTANSPRDVLAGGDPTLADSSFRRGGVDVRIKGVTAEQGPREDSLDFATALTEIPDHVARTIEDLLMQHSASFRKAKGVE